MKEINANKETLKRNLLDLIELQYILHKTQVFFQEVRVGREEGGAVRVGGQIMQGGEMGEGEGYIEENDNEGWCRRERRRYEVEEENLCDILRQGKAGKIEGRGRSLLTRLSCC